MRSVTDEVSSCSDRPDWLAAKRNFDNFERERRVSESWKSSQVQKKMPTIVSGSRRASVIDVHIGGRIRTARLLIGMGQPELAAQMGISFQQLQKYERGQSRISVARLDQAARLLGFSIAYFCQDLASSAAEATAAERGKAADALLALLDAPGTAELARDLATLDARIRSEVAAIVHQVVRLRMS